MVRTGAGRPGPVMPSTSTPSSGRAPKVSVESTPTVTGPVGRPSRPLFQRAGSSAYGSVGVDALAASSAGSGGVLPRWTTTTTAPATRSTSTDAPATHG